MRSVSTIVAGVERLFVPEMDGEPIRVILRSATEAVKRVYTKGTIGCTPLTPENAERKDAWDRWLLEQTVVRVEDYVVNGQKIETAGQLWDQAETHVGMLVRNEVARSLTLQPEQKKTSDASSGSPPIPTAPSAGAAPSVEPSSSTVPEAAAPER